MSVRELNPGSNIPSVILPSNASPDDVHVTPYLLPYAMYTDESDFKEGCAEQVAYTYYALGSTLDIEISKYDVFAHYQRACYLYSYWINQYQAKNVLSSALGTKTGQFDSEGNLVSGGGMEPGTHLELKYPRISMNLADRYTSMVAHYSMVGGNENVYRTNFELIPGTQDYDLQAVIYLQSTTDTTKDFYGKIEGNERVYITQVWYVPPIAQWRFFGLWGMGMNVMGNLSSYGMWADDSTFQIVPTWQNRLQAMAFKEAMNIRVSHYSYEIKNNKIRLFPTPSSSGPPYMWLEFRLSSQPFEEDENIDDGMNGVNNINTIPFENIPYRSINSSGKHWIRDYALALSKETLGHVRSKISSGIPFMGGAVTLDGPALLAESKDDKRRLEDELKKLLEETSYAALLKTQAEIMGSVHDVKTHFPSPIYLM